MIRSLLTLGMLLLAACGGASDTDAARPESQTDDSSSNATDDAEDAQDSGVGTDPRVSSDFEDSVEVISTEGDAVEASQLSEDSVESRHEMDDTSPTDSGGSADADEERIELGAGGEPVAEGIEAVPCASGDESCDCYGNDTCNGSLECVLDVCVAVDGAESESMQPEAPVMDCLAGAVDCPCQPDGSCDAELQCEKGICVRLEVSEMPQADDEAPVGEATAPDPLPGQGPVTTEIGECVEHRTVEAAECELAYECVDGLSYARCWHAEEATWRCSCGLQGFITELELADVATDNPCEPLWDACNSVSKPAPVGEPECGPSGGAWADNYCAYNEQCVQPLDYGDGFTAHLTLTGTIRCYLADGDVWACDCGGEGLRDAPFEFVTTTHPMDVCLEAWANCPTTEARQLRP